MKNHFIISILTVLCIVVLISNITEKARRVRIETEYELKLDSLDSSISKLNSDLDSLSQISKDYEAYVDQLTDSLITIKLNVNAKMDSIDSLTNDELSKFLTDWARRYESVSGY